jgi:hypothetical protein
MRAARFTAASKAEIKREITMNFLRIATTLFGASLLFAMGAFAQEKSTLNVTETVKVQGTELKPGIYVVEWDGSGPTVQVSIHQGKNTLGTFPATVVAVGSANSSNAMESQKEPGGSLSIVSIYPKGKKYQLEVGQKQASIAH